MSTTIPETRACWTERTWSGTDLARAAELPSNLLNVLLRWANTIPSPERRWTKRELIAAAAIGRVYADMRAFHSVPGQPLVRRVWEQVQSAVVARHPLVSIGLGTLHITIDVRAIQQRLGVGV